MSKLFDQTLNFLEDRYYHLRTGCNYLPKKIDLTHILIRTMIERDEQYRPNENVCKKIINRQEQWNNTEQLTYIDNYNKLLFPLNVNETMYGENDDLFISTSKAVGHKDWRCLGFEFCQNPIVTFYCLMDKSQGILTWNRSFLSFNKIGKIFLYGSQDDEIPRLTIGQPIEVSWAPPRKITGISDPDKTDCRFGSYQIGLEHSVLAQLEYEDIWHIAIEINNQLEILFYTEPEEIKKIVKERDKNILSKRRDGLINFVSSHERILDDGGDIRYVPVKKYLRGHYQCRFCGYLVKIFPSHRAVHEQNINHRQSEKTIELLELLDTI